LQSALTGGGVSSTCYKGEAHVVVMPNVTMALLERFMVDYVNWWGSAANGTL
jgi:hypothetical protein